MGQVSLSITHCKFIQVSIKLDRINTQQESIYNFIVVTIIWYHNYIFNHLFLRCCVLPRHLNVPFTIIARREHSASHSSMLCEVRITEWPSFTIELMQSHRNRRAFGSMPVVGSSRKMIGGSPMRAMAVESLRLLPPL